MQDKSIKYQLYRMVLVNAGTNKHVPSGRITAIDPRGGAAVVGDNGVGKTTTLRILPLFFGHLPSQIVAAGQGQDAMIRFVLPTDASAIAFEYQRGSDAEGDLRLAVIRRRADDPDVPFYRLYRCGFRKDLFVQDGRFLSDEETQARANELNIQTTQKLTTAEYRSVILRTQAASKDKEKLRRYSIEWSFGPKQLDNLDRIVAAMVKKHINFNDIVHVAVGLVQHDLGQGAERAKLNFKMGRAPIEQWLRNREACQDAFNRAPAFSELEYGLRDHSSAEARFRACRADVSVLQDARNREAEQVKASLEKMAVDRAVAAQAEAVEQAALEESARAASREATTTKLAYEEAEAVAGNLEAEDAAQWERKLQEVPALRASLHAVQSQVDAAEAQHAEVTNRYRQLDSDARSEAGEQKLVLEKSKEPHRVRLGETLTQIAASETQALQRIAEETAAKRQALDETREPIIEQRGVWESLKRNPAASAAALAALEEAGQRLQQHTEELGTVRELAQRMLAAKQAALNDFAAQERDVAAARASLLTAQSALAETKARLDPPEGTLLAALRASAIDQWKRDFAKVIDPSLLSRDDLDPALLDDAAESVFGWRLNTGAIATPDWADDALARQAVEAAQERMAAAQAHLQAQQDALGAKNRKLQEADLSVQTTQARVEVLKRQSEERKNQLEAARLRVLAEKKGAAAKADDELRKVNAALEDLKRQRQTLDREDSIAREEAKTTHQKLRAEAEALCRAALGSIDASIAKIESDLEVAVRRIAEQLQEHLGKEGVDVTRLANLKQEAAGLRREIQNREDREPLVKRWKKWLEDGGRSRVESLKETARRAAEASAQAARRLSECLHTAQKAQEAYTTALEAQEKRQRQLRDDLETLAELDDSFGAYAASGGSVIDPATPVSELKSTARRIRKEIDDLEASITKRTGVLRQALTAKNSTVKDLVEAALGQSEDGSAISRAAALVHCYRQIGPQVANDVNITLRTLLANIGAFHKALQSFEREVASFNRRLQAGLNEVKCFERVKDLRLDIVTNFDDLGFYKKLSQMEEVVRQHANEVGKDFTRELPSDETARALSGFMSVLGADGNVEVNLSQRISLKGSVNDNGKHKEFKRASELEGISSEGLTSLVLITLMTALLNTIRGAEPVHVPWVTDEVGKFDPRNFRALMERLRDNRIDVVTASPELGPTQQAMFAKHYLFEDRGRVLEFRPSGVAAAAKVEPVSTEVTQ